MIRRAVLPLAALALVLLAWAAPAIAGPDRAAPPDRREVVNQVLDILNRPEFEGSEEEEEGLLLLLANYLSDLLDRIKAMRKEDPVLYGSIVGWLVLTLVAILGHVAWTVWKGGAARRRVTARGALLDPALATRAGRDPDRMLARADAEAAAGRREDAVAWLYLALLFRLERADRVEFDPARTGLEYADALARRPATRQLWNDFLRDHDPVVFGDRPCAEPTFERLRTAATAPLPEDGRGA